MLPLRPGHPHLRPSSIGVPHGTNHLASFSMLRRDPCIANNLIAITRLDPGGDFGKSKCDSCGKPTYQMNNVAPTKYQYWFRAILGWFSTKKIPSETHPPTSIVNSDFWNLFFFAKPLSQLLSEKDLAEHGVCWHAVHVLQVYIHANYGGILVLNHWGNCIAYNNVSRFLCSEPRNCSAGHMFVSRGLPTRKMLITN